MRILVSFLIILTIFIFNGCAKKEERPKVLEPKKEILASPVKKEVPFQRKGIEKILYAFENDMHDWNIPDWALEKEDYVARNASLSKDFSKEGASSLKIDVDFPGKVWTTALVEVMQYLDFSPYMEISCDIYLPKEAPVGLKAKLILTVGENWKFTEMSRSIPLVPGEWTTVKANILSGSEDWKATVMDDGFRGDVRKIAIRVESNRSPVYKGPVYIDNIKVSN